MIFKKKAAILSALVFILALVYILSFVFDPQRQNRQAFAWLEKEFLGLADRIEIYGSGVYDAGGNAGEIILLRKNNVWVIPSGAADYPVKQGRVDDFLAVFSRKGVYPLRAASAMGRERLGLEEGTASRIVVRGGAGLPLLDLLVGTGDALGRGVYLRRAGKNEIFSGEDNFTLYTESVPGFWYDLRLFPSGASGQGRSAAPLSVDAVQQAEITLPQIVEDESRPLPFMLRRSGNGWIMPGNEGAELETTKVEAWLRSVLEAEAEDFGTEVPVSFDGNITLRFGDGTSRTIQTGPADEAKRRSAAVSQSGLIYILPEWSLNRIFRGSSSFLKTQ